MQNQWNKTDRRKTCPSGTSTTTDPTRTWLGSNPGLHDERPCLQQTCILKKTSEELVASFFKEVQKKCQAKNEYTLKKSRVDNCSSEAIGTVVLGSRQAWGHWKSDGGDKNGEYRNEEM